MDGDGRDTLRRVLGVDELREAQDSEFGGLVGGQGGNDDVGADAGAVVSCLTEPCLRVYSSGTYLDTVTTCFSESSLSNINGKKYLATKNGPFTLTSQTLHHFSGSLSVIMAISMRPALLTITSSLPATLLTSAAASETDFGSVTSSFNSRTLGSGLPASRAAFLISFELASSDERAPRTM
jgi:hypothetical protein